MMNEHTTNWPDLAIGLYERLTGKNAVGWHDPDHREGRGDRGCSAPQ